MLGKRTRELFIGVASIALLAAVASGMYVPYADTEQMHSAVDSGDLGRALRWVRQRANPNSISPKGRTPLMLAVSRGDVESATDLLDAGADVNAVALWVPPGGKKGVLFPPLSIAAAKGNRRMVQLLLERGANPTLRDGLGMTAAEQASDSAIKSLLLAAQR